MAGYDADQIRRENTIDAVAGKFGVSLTRDGKEWRACCPFHAENTPSFTIFPAKSGAQKFYCFGCSVTGDVIDFVREWESCTFQEACEILGGKRQPRVDPPQRQSSTADDPYAGYVSKSPPTTAPAITASKPVEVWNPKRGRSVTYRPSLVHEYPGVGYVLRVDIGDGRKLTPAILWMTGPDGFEGWSHGSMPTPRPLYGLPGLLERLSAQVLIVEGEKCRDAAAAALPSLVVVSWCGGGKAAAKTDWTPLAGRKVVIWPDNDDPGLATGQAVAELVTGVGSESIKVLDLAGLEKPKGWDVADAIQHDWMDRDDLVQFCRARAKVWQRREVTPNESNGTSKKSAGPFLHATRPRQQITAGGAVAVFKPNPAEKPQEAPQPKPHRDNITSLHGDPIPASDDLDDYRLHLLMNDEGKLKPKAVNNFYWMLRGHPETRGMYAFNEVAGGVFVLRRPPWDTAKTNWRNRPLTDDDIIKSAHWLERHLLGPKKNEARDAIKAVAGHHQFNPIRDYLTRLKWDGIPRLKGGAHEGDSVPHAAAEYLGAPTDAIFGTFLTKWHVSAVARIMRPGCKADCMLIVEGPQGKMKSTYLRQMATIDGHEYFADGIGDISNKDSIMLMQGCWIVENAELAGFRRQELNQIKAWLSRTTDRYIPKFESEPREVPRTFVASGTHNPSGQGYLTDPTGNRRFWPLPVAQIDLARVMADKDQIWAEAMALYQAGETWWLSADEERECDLLTEARRAEDPWVYGVERAIDDAGMVPTVSMEQIIRSMNIPVAQQTEITIKRIGDVLRIKGFRQEGQGKWARPSH